MRDVIDFSRRSIIFWDAEYHAADFSMASISVYASSRARNASSTTARSRVIVGDLAAMGVRDHTARDRTVEHIQRLGLREQDDALLIDPHLALAFLFDV